MAQNAELQAITFDPRSEYDPISGKLVREWIRATGTFKVNNPMGTEFEVTVREDVESEDAALAALRETFHHLMSGLAEQTKDWAASADATPAS